MLRPGTLCSASQTPASTVLAQLTQKHTQTSRSRESFSGQSSLRLRLRALLFAAIVFRHTNKHTHTRTSALRVTASPPSDKSHSGKMPSFHYTYNFQTVTQVKPALVVNLNGSACVIRRGFVTLLLTRVEHGSDCPALSRLLYWEWELNFIIWAFKRHSRNFQAFVKTETETESTGGVEQRKGSVSRIENETSWCLQYFMLFSGTGTLYPWSSCTL